MRQTLTVFVALQVVITVMVLSLLGYTSYFSSSDTKFHDIVQHDDLGSPLLKGTFVKDLLNATDSRNLFVQSDTTAIQVRDKEEVRPELVNTTPRTVQPNKTASGSLSMHLLTLVKGTPLPNPPRAFNSSKVIINTATTNQATPAKQITLVESAQGPTLGSLNNSQGYTLLYSVFEESTNGAKNIWQFQRLANLLGTRVVEPFAIDSVFRMNGLAPNFKQSLQFGDYFDLEKWNKMVVQHGGSPLVKWEEFLLNAPREAVVLYTMKSTNLSEPLIIAYDDDLATKCNVGKGAIVASDLNWLEKRFNITKTMCYYCAVNKKHHMSMEEFIAHVFGNKKPNQVTLIIVGWLGMRQSRVDVGPKSLLSFPSLAFPVSKRIIQAYQSYKSLYIGDRKYVGIIFRTHHVLYFSPLTGSFANQSKYLLQCSKKLGHVLDKVRKKWKIFMAYDMGTFGSKVYATGQAKRLAPLRDQIFLDVFNGSLQIKEREEMLKQAAGGITDRGFIAQLEKIIATNADCIILLGPHSGFVRSSAAQYMSLHETKRCIISICSELVYDSNRHLVTTNDIPDSFIDT